MTSIKFKTVRATLVDGGQIKVVGLNSLGVLSEHPDTGAALERRNEWRSGIRAALVAAGADEAAVWSAEWVN